MEIGFQWIFETISTHGLAGVLLVMFLVYGRKFLNSVMDRYCRELDKKDATINNHLDHVNNSLNAVCTQTIVTKQALDNGFERVVDAINTQTQILKPKIKEE
jgi:hypothetical protein